MRGFDVVFIKHWDRTHHANQSLIYVVVINNTEVLVLRAQNSTVAAMAFRVLEKAKAQ